MSKSRNLIAQCIAFEGIALCIGGIRVRLQSTPPELTTVTVHRVYVEVTCAVGTRVGW